MDEGTVTSNLEKAALVLEYQAAFVIPEKMDCK